MENFKSYFKSLGITKVDACKQIGISRQALYNLLQGKQMSVNTARKIQAWSGGRLDASRLLGIENKRG